MNRPVCLSLFSAALIAPMVLSSVVLAAAPAKLSPPEVTLMPHKALYDVELVSAKTGSQMVNISGKMFYEWKPSCEGWITNHRFDLNYDYADSAPVNITSDFTTFESFDGKTLNYSSRRSRDGETYDELRGRAEMKAKGAGGMAVYSIPENLTFNLEKGTLFPTGHTISLIDQARKSKKFYDVHIFDGSDSDGPVDINSFIGALIPPGKATDKEMGKAIGKKESGFKPASTNSIDNGLLDTNAWNVRMAFFPLKNPAATSDYELSMVFHENGIISDMLIEYSDFTVRQKLVALEKIKPETCKN